MKSLFGFALFFLSLSTFAEIKHPVLLPLDQVIEPHLQQREILNKEDRKISSFAGAKVELPLSIDLRKYATTIKEQQDPWCTAFAMAAVMEINGTEKSVNRSISHVWSKYRQYSCETAVRQTQGAWITSEYWWAYGNKRPYRGYLDGATVRFTSNEYLDGDLNKVMQTLAYGRSVYMGLSVSDSLYKGDKVVNAFSKNTGGGHSVAVVGYKRSPEFAGGGAILIKNSWGEDCGDKGYQWLPFAYCERSDSYCVFWDLKGFEHWD
jgi:C1A family cysteine protease